MKDKKILVTGAGGFIGSHLAEKLLAIGCKVTALLKYNSTANYGCLAELSHKNLEVRFGDVRDPFAVNKLLKNCDMVFHLAALIGIPYSYEAPQSYIETNLNGTLNILEAAREHKTGKIILTSTSEVYGTAQTTPMCENHPLQAQSPYAASKIAADKLGESYARSFGLPVTIVRPFNTFGPRQSMRAVIPTIIVQGLKSPEISLGSLSPVRDFNFVSDTVAGFIQAAKKAPARGEVFNLATGKGRSIKETVDLVQKILGINKPVISKQNRKRPPDSEVFKLIGSAKKAETTLKWKPETTFENALRLTAGWIEKNLEKFPLYQNYAR